MSSERSSDLYTVFEDEDGISVVPTKWITPTKSHCKWPSHFNFTKIIKAISKLIDPCDNWNVISVKKIFTTTCKLSVNIMTTKPYVGTIKCMYNKSFIS